MTAGTRLAVVTQRIASATSVIRTRTQDGERLEVHGGRNGDLETRWLAALADHEKRLQSLEKAIS